LQQPRAAVVLNQLAEVLPKALVLQERRGHRRKVFKAMNGEDVLDQRLGLEPDEDVVAEQQQPPRLDDVARHAVVLRADPVAAEQRHLEPAEDVQPALVERGRLRPERLARRRKAVAEDFVGALFDGHGWVTGSCSLLVAWLLVTGY